MAFTQGHALLIGAGTYRHAPAADLPVTAADATALGAVLSDPGLCGYPSEQVRVLRGEGATRANILAALDELAQRTTGVDTLFFFYSGHGLAGDDGRYHLATHDSRIDNGRLAAGSGIGADELLARLQAVPAGQALLIFDTTHTGLPASMSQLDSGAQAPHLPTGTLPATLAVALLASGQDRAVITSCRTGQEAHVGNSLLTIFTQALFDGLRGIGMTDSGGYISSAALHGRVHRVVVDTVREAYGAVQEPELIVPRGARPFAVALYQGETVSDPAGPAAAPGSAPGDASAAVREVDGAAGSRALAEIMRSGVWADVAANAGVSAGVAPVTAPDPSSAPAFHDANAPGQQEFVDLLKQLRRAIMTSDLADDEKTDAIQGLGDVDAQITHAEPQLPVIRQGLERTRAVVGSAIGGAAAEPAQTMVALADQALELAGGLYQPG